jgi:hypothetical protein
MDYGVTLPEVKSFATLQFRQLLIDRRGRCSTHYFPTLIHQMALTSLQFASLHMLLALVKVVINLLEVSRSVDISELHQELALRLTLHR